MITPLFLYRALITLNKNPIGFKNFISGYFLFVFLLLSDAQINAQTTGQDQQTGLVPVGTDSLTPIRQQSVHLNKEFIVSSIKEGITVTASPLYWKKKDWLTFSALAAGVGGLMIVDKQVKSIFQHNQNNFTSSLAGGVEPVGNIYGLLLFPAIYGTGLILKDPHIQSIGLRGGKAMAISSVLVFAGKNLIRRQRPDAAITPFNYALPFSKVKYNSFPSAHSSIAFTLATAFAMEFPDKKWVAPVAYSIASLTALSRVYDNRHWASDVLVGAALGHFVTKAVYNNYHKKHRKAKTFM